MSTILQIKSAESLHDVAHILGFKPSALSYILYKKNSKNKYKKFSISKRGGGKREISVPFPDLMNLQKRLSEILQNCILEINANRSIKSTLSHGFRKKYSIITNAKIHRGKRYVFNLDLENYFGSINFGRVRGYFIKNRNFKLNPKVATIFAQIACNDNALPQGSPCSPVISNLIGHVLDIKLAKIAYDNGCHYSRYADDLSFSTNKIDFPIEIAKISNEENKWEVGDNLVDVISMSGFSVNKSKTRMQYQESRQDVTGLIVNKKLNTRCEYWRTARAMAHSLFTTGKYVIKKQTSSTDGKTTYAETEGTIEQLNGMLSFIDSIDGFNKKVIENTRDRRRLNSREKVFRNFLFYKYFYANEMPLIICEGKTDNVYIKAAIHSLYSRYPTLSEKDTNGNIKLKIKLFNFTHVTDRILHLSGGTPDLAKFTDTYLNQCKKYSNKASQFPVIILVDNDDGAKKVINVANKKTKSDNGKNIVHVGENLYVLAIPKIKNKETMIEDYFDNEILNMKINGKRFSRKKSFDKEHEYGKHLFAEVIVKKNRNIINFGKFDKILDKINAVIVEHN